MISLKTFYDEHPINETEILAKLAAEGIAQADIRVEDLTRYDQDHYGGLGATDRLAEALAIAPGMRVLDVCSGLGGTSRYLAHRFGASVHGVDLTESRVLGARRLTAMVGLDGKVTFEVGDAASLQVQPEGFDRVVSQEAFLHIADKEAVLAGCHAALKSGGGFGFTDWVATDLLNEDDRAFFAETFAAPRLIDVSQYRSLLRASHFAHLQVVDLSEEWRAILAGRLEMFRSLETETVAQFGRERFDSYIRNYEFFVARIAEGALGGARFVGWKQ